jgi:hypothetical protein
MLKIIEEYLELEDNESKNVEGHKGSTPIAQPPPRTSTTHTSPITHQPDADVTSTQAGLMTSTSEGSSRRLGSGDDVVVAK